MARKIRASNERWHKMLGSIGTAEKLTAKRLAMARHEWDRMKATDACECRNCHDYGYMDFAEQGRRANRAHEQGFSEGETCIDCHKGIAHSLPPIDQAIGAVTVDR
ncbi:MAG: NapC/NirT family cytochrome c [Burkholderiales bacterium]|nr:NapC/NirT family cytochrome c [Burkholderiales bacterium]